VIKERGFLIKLDTNGSRPDRLEKLLAAGLVDCVAMDIKAPLERYPEVVRAPVDVADIVRSVDIVRGAGPGHLFRTTVVPGLVGEDDIRKIGEWLHGAPLFQIQSFAPVRTLDPAFQEIKPYGKDEINRMVDAAGPHFGEVRVEGV
jgi:pyruvate formate lyase activating enzyme